MLRNSVEYTSSIFVYHDIAESFANHLKKKYSDPPTKCSLTRQDMISHLTVEVLSKADSANFVGGRWVDSDALFGSSESCIQLKSQDMPGAVFHFHH